MKFSDIRPGYMVELRNGFRFMIHVIDSGVLPIVGVGEHNEWLEFTSQHYSEDMTEKLFKNTDFDIVKVWGYSSLATQINDFECPGRYRKLLYERGRARVLSLEEIEKILGYPVIITEVNNEQVYI